MVHDMQNAAADRGATGHNFFEAFETVLHLTATADIMYGNLETILGGASRPYKGYPRFNSPDSFAEALKRSGFDILQTANNHSNDQGEAGLLRTLNVLGGLDLPALGTFASSEAAQEPWLVLETQGFRIGFLAYTFGTNGIPTPSDREYQVAMLKVPRAVREITALRKLGVDAVVVGLHWGREYTHEPRGAQVLIAKKLVEAGADILLGGHPHVLQPMELIQGQGENAREGLVHYSLGNFISNMYRRPTELGIVLEVTLAKPEAGGAARLAGVRYAPIWVHKYGSGRDRRYFVRDLVDVVELCSAGGAQLELLHLDSRACADATYSLNHAASFYGTELRLDGGRSTSPPHTLVGNVPSPEGAAPRAADSTPIPLTDGMLRVSAGLLPARPNGEFTPPALPWDAPEFDGQDAPLPAFAIDTHEVRGTDYAAFLAAQPAMPRPGERAQPAHPFGWMKRTPPEGLADHPVTTITRDDARAYCAWRGARLPSIREWRMAAGGPEGLLFPWGDSWAPEASNSFEQRWADVAAPDGFERSAPVGSFPSGVSGSGALDMSGNVEEWVEASSAASEALFSADPPGSSEALLAGGSWFERDSERLSSRSVRRVEPNFLGLTAGFRCARDLAPGE